MFSAATLPPVKPVKTDVVTAATKLPVVSVAKATESAAMVKAVVFGSDDRRVG